MGSSKKHRGEKEAAGTTAAAGTGGATEQPPRHREHKKHKHRSGGSGGSGGERRKRSRERGAERGGGRRGSETEARSGAHGRERSQAEPSERRVKREKRDDGYEAAASSKTSSGDASSLSIEETNKLRAKLGLKPLEVNAVKKEAGTKEEPVAADVINPMALRQREELREKLAAAKEKRLLNQKLGKIKTLGEDDPWLDDTAAWIERSRQLQKEKDLAEKRAKLLEEMDQEFGVSTLVEEEFGQRRQDLYSARDLQGLTVEHAIDSFQEGQTMILTLKDKGVLQEEEDVLVNVNLVDKERAEKNVELRKKKPDYLPYAEDESVDDLAQQKPRSILAKYDEELEGERPHSFRLEQGGIADGLRERELEEIRTKLRLQAQSLSMVGPRLASEYLTPEEMVSPQLLPTLVTGAVVEIVKKLESRQRGLEEDEDPERKGTIVFNATSEFCRTLGEIPTYGLAGNREEQEELMDFERDEERSANGGSESDGEENIGWSTVNLDEEKQHQDFSASSTTILDEEPIVNRGLAAALLLCQNKGLLETTVQKVARVKAPNKSLPSAVYCIEDKMAIDDKYSRREEYRGFTQDFKEKDGYKPDVKIEYVDETGRKLTPKEAFRQLSHRFHGKGSGKMKTERRMKKLDEEALLKKMSSSDTPLGTVALLQEKQKAQKTPYIVLSGSGKSMNANTITK
ncbi:U4/U6.U5 tri-snRNP-associated protein 1 [Myotis daubentonii]|uniref:U4/U6.U5 tri-snRNP-associated protein 1 n=1 Tax=Myotis daubentonii TaxID=98922 RepID=UPI002873ED21|nr:U4/U6.U5 tri-snRNP-associated protein 1 [Myotis daubentonii]